MRKVTDYMANLFTTNEHKPHEGDTMTEQPDELSVLDWFVAAAMKDMQRPMSWTGDNPYEKEAAECFLKAEAIMAERAKRQPQQTEAK